MNRTELIRQIKKDCDKNTVKGNSLWTIKSGNIILYELYQDGNEWNYDCFPESEIPQNIVSCPENYLDITDTVNIEWRVRVRDYNSLKRTRRDEIKKLFQDGQTVTVKLAPRNGYRLTVDLLVVEQIYPSILGRSLKDNKLYSVPLGLIDEIMGE